MQLERKSWGWYQAVTGLEKRVIAAFIRAEEEYERSDKILRVEWLREFLLPALDDEDLTLIPDEELHTLTFNAKAMAHVADVHKSEEEQLREYVQRLEVRIARAINVLSSELDPDVSIPMAADELHKALLPNSKVRQEDYDLRLPEDDETQTPSD